LHKYTQFLRADDLTQRLFFVTSALHLRMPKNTCCKWRVNHKRTSQSVTKSEKEKEQNVYPVECNSIKD